MEKGRLRDWSLITGGGGLQNGKITGPNLFAPPPPPQDRITLFAAPLFKGWKLFAASLVLWLKLQAPVLKQPQNLLCPPPFSMAKTPFFVGVELHLPPPSRFVAPTLPIISDQSLHKPGISMRPASPTTNCCRLPVYALCPVH